VEHIKITKKGRACAGKDAAGGRGEPLAGGPFSEKASWDLVISGSAARIRRLGGF